jgi:hypothetical protein
MYETRALAEKPATNSQTSKPPQTVDVIDFTNHRRGPPGPPYDEFFGRYHFSGLEVTSGPGGPIVARLGTSLQVPLIPTDDPAHAAFINSGFPNAGAGEIVPLFDDVYKVAELSWQPNERIRLERVKEPELLKEIGINPGSIAVPTGSGIQMLISHDTGRNTYLDVKAIKTGGGKEVKLTAKLKVRNSTPDMMQDSVAHVDETEPEVAVGNTVQLAGGYRLIVAKIVPSDKSRKIIGWVEFTPTRHSETEKK